MLARPQRSDRAGTQGRFALGMYRALWRALSPAASYALRARAARGKEDPARLRERFGHAAEPRPAGTVIWVHGASVGECLAALPLIARLLEGTDRHVLVTSGTTTSAQLLAERLPPGAIHQYVPLDRRTAVRRFLTHWRPDLALFVESELWPNLIEEARAAGTPMALVNARLSARSFKGWQRAKGLAARLLSAFDVCLAQDQEIASRLERLGARHVRITGSLKADAAPLPDQPSARMVLFQAVETRPLFLAAQTHPGEDEIILGVTRALLEKHRDLLTIIVPRHPERGPSIAEAAKSHNLSAQCRSTGVLPRPDTQVYIANTLGELGVFYRMVDFAFIGGSLVPHGGHNPLEAAMLGTAVLTGPHTENFATIFDALLAGQGGGRIASSEELIVAVAMLLADPSKATASGEAAHRAAQSLGGALARTASIAEDLLQAHAHA